MTIYLIVFKTHMIKCIIQKHITNEKSINPEITELDVFM